MSLFKSSPPKLVLLGGAPAAGKSSTCAELRRRKIVCLDKDLIAGALVDQALLQAGEDPSRRDSELYVNTLRPMEYEALLTAAEACLSSGQSAVLDAPFISQTQDGEWMNALYGRFPEAEVHLVWLDCGHHDCLERMKQRDLPRDQGKIDGSEDYQHPRPPRDLATVVLDSQKLSPIQLADEVEKLLK